MSYARKLACLLLPLLLLAGLVLSAPAAASSFTFGGDNYMKIKSRGNLDPWLSPVTGTSAGGGDALMNMYVGIFNFNLFDVIGTSSPSVGDTFSGLDYGIDQQRGVLSPNVYVTSDYFRRQGPDKRHLPNSFDLSANLNLTSITFDDTYQITLRGYLSDVFINNATASAVLTDMAGAGDLDFMMTLYRTDKTSGEFIPVLQSKHGSTWAGLGGTISGAGGAVPEPGTLLLLASGLAGAAGWRLRLRLRKRPA